MTVRPRPAAGSRIAPVVRRVLIPRFHCGRGDGACRPAARTRE
jgi:hypothetical protein